MNNNGAPINCPKCGEAMSFHWDRELQEILMSCVKERCKGLWKQEITDVSGEAGDDAV